MTNINLSKITYLKNIIINELTPLIDKDFVLLDIPDHDNIGDNLIWEGELVFLKNLKHRKLYEASYLFFDQKRIPDNALILIHGGGNFGDIYKRTQEDRIKVILNNLDKKIIILPQTVYYKNEDNLKADSTVVNQHPNLIFCVRDQSSFDIVQRNFPYATPKLIPDMAFCIDPANFSVQSTAHKTLLMKRKDGELGDIPSIEGEYDTLDWPTFNMSKEERWKIIGQKNRLDKIAVMINKIPFINRFLIDSRYGLKPRNNKENYIKTGIDFFSEYDTIYTTRLHGLILGVMMGKNMKVLDNSYGKVTGFYNKWLKDFKNIEVVSKN